MTVRIVSLVPSVTETLLAWGIEPIACTRFCEQPDLRQVGGTKDPDVDAVVALRPDLVVLNDEENRREDHDALVAAGCAVHVVRIAGLPDVADALRALGAAVDAAVERPALPPPATGPALRAFVPIWKRPWMTMGGDTYGSSLLAWIGVENVYADSARYPEVTLVGAAARCPDVVLAPSEPYPFGERHRAELEEVAPVLLVDGQDLFWWGARTAAAVERLRSVVSGRDSGAG